MNVIKNQISDSQIKLEITIPIDDIRPFMEKTAKKLSLKHKINGFRPGKAGYDIIARQFGEMTILQESLNQIIDNTLIDALKQENIDFIGMPDIEVQKIAPDNDFIYTAICDLMPTADVPTDWKSIKIERKKEDVSEEKITDVINELATSKAKQILKDDTAQNGDKVFIDFELSIDNVIPDGGVAKNFEVLIGDEKMIPGFEEQLIGLKKDDEKTFEITFPATYFKKEFADKKGTFKIKVLHVFSMEKPALDESFAETFGHKTFDDLKNIIKENLQKELDDKNENIAELKMFDTLIEKTKYSTIPESMIEQEKNTMINEMRSNAEKQGIDFNDYLQHIKKSMDDLKKEFHEDAIKRVKSGLILKTIRERENINVSDEEVVSMIEKAHKHAHEHNEKHDHEMNENNPRYKEFVRNTIAIQKVTKLMKDAMLSE